MATEGSLDYKAMFEQCHEALINRLALEDERGNLLREISEDTDEVTLATDNLNNMNLSDQIALLRATANYCIVSKRLCEKYNYFEDKTDDL